MDGQKEISGHIVDVLRHIEYDGTLVINGGKIAGIRQEAVPQESPYILPGFIDSHVHIESTLLTPEHYAAMAVRRGVTAIITDPHEIANVLGIKGIEYMIANGGRVHFHFNFGVPSCVPCTPFETSGATIGHSEIADLLKRDDICCVSEFMNAPGVLGGDPECLSKLSEAVKAGKPVDGHAPGMGRGDLVRYAAAGISTDHECVTLEEGRDHIAAGMYVMIREGSASCDYEALAPLLAESAGRLMFCSDDKYADEFAEGYIDSMVARAVKDGYPLWNVLDAACLTPVRHYGLKHGMLQPGDNADFILTDNLTDFNVLSTWIDGRAVFDSGTVCMDELIIDSSPCGCPPNAFAAGSITTDDITVKGHGRQIKVISAMDRTLRTGVLVTTPKVQDGLLVSDATSDILKLVVHNRYKKAEPQVAFIHGFGLTKGAIASSIAHDSHNIIATGVDDEDIARAVNRVIELKGGIVIADGDRITELPLPVAGLMSDLSGEEVAGLHIALKEEAKRLGCEMDSPFMTLSFMALPVIPDLKLTDKGLFDANSFRFTDMEV